MILMAAWQCVMHRRVSTLMAAGPVGMPAGLPSANAFPLRSTPTVTTLYPMDWLIINALIRYFDFALFCVNVNCHVDYSV